jgi:hypothetical protein
MEPVTPRNTPSTPETDAAFSPVTLCHCTTLQEAQMLVSLLQSYGIGAVIDGENYYGLLGGVMAGYGGIRVQVRQLDAEAALEILDEGAKSPPIEEME